MTAKKALPRAYVILSGLSTAVCAAPAPQFSTVTAPVFAERVVQSTEAAITESTATERPDIEAVQVAFATAVSSMMPVNPATSFDESVNQVYFWNRIRVRHPPARFKHIWYLDDRKVEEFHLEARYPKMRVWTHKKVAPGLWRVEIADDADRVIMVGAFVVRQAASAPGALKKKSEP